MTAVGTDPGVSAAVAPPLVADRPERTGSGRWDLLKAYVSLTKPRIIELLLVTTVPTMILAGRGLPSLGLAVFTLTGGALAAGSANALNCYLDRDIDRLMHRTQHRPLATGRISPRSALVFAIALGALSLTLLASTVNVVSAILTLAAILFYVFGYTLLLKRRTASNIVWGGAAGCMPVLIGWSAVTGSLSWTPLVLFGVIFFWTPPHYWPLSLRFRDDYAKAAVPMLPVVAPETTVASRVVAYSWAMVVTSLVLVPVAGMGPVYAAVAVLAGAWFLGEAYRLKARAVRGRTGQDLAPMRLFHASISYLTLVFAAVALDPLLPVISWSAISSVAGG